MTEIIATLTLAFALGLAAARFLIWMLGSARGLRAAILASVPPSLLIVVFLVFFDGTPQGEDWFWLGVGFAYFWPWYIAWGLGSLTEALIRLRFARQPR